MQDCENDGRKKNGQLSITGQKKLEAVTLAEYDALNSSVAAAWNSRDTPKQFNLGGYINDTEGYYAEEIQPWMPPHIVEAAKQLREQFRQFTKEQEARSEAFKKWQEKARAKLEKEIVKRQDAASSWKLDQMRSLKDTKEDTADQIEKVWEVVREGERQKQKQFNALQMKITGAKTATIKSIWLQGEEGQELLGTIPSFDDFVDSLKDLGVKNLTALPAELP